ncbi:MAG TPA: helix-turn-helix domain-containing protein [Acidimicrobiales bacterium]
MELDPTVHSLPPTNWVDTKTLMNHLSIKTPALVTRLIREGMPAHRIGKGYRYDLREVDAWIRASSRWNERLAGETA